jgi:hypothetical protein
MDLRWKHPFTALVVGPTQSGKTVFTFKFIREARKLIHPPPKKSFVVMASFNQYSVIIRPYLSTMVCPI